MMPPLQKTAPKKTALSLFIQILNAKNRQNVANILHNIYLLLNNTMYRFFCQPIPKAQKSLIIRVFSASNTTSIVRIQVVPPYLEAIIRIFFCKFFIIL